MRVFFCKASLLMLLPVYFVEAAGGQAQTAPSRIFISGGVRLGDGNAPPTRVLIERDCAGIVRQEAYTDSNGNFSFLLGAQNSNGLADATVGDDPWPKAAGTATAPAGTSERQLAGCEIRAKLAGFLSDSIQLGFRRPLDNPNIGAIYLHPIQNLEDEPFSITTELASKKARTAYEKGLANMKKQKWADAERELHLAVEDYPRYVVAWNALGRAHEMQKEWSDANRAYLKAVEIDPRFTTPYGHLATLALAERKWDAAALYTSTMLKLNPFASSDIYFSSALANYNLQNVDIAEDHARQAAELDRQHRNPKINRLLGVILVQKKEYAAAEVQLNTYLKFNPAAADADAVKRILSQIAEAGSQPR
jgi:tetratricopeptide (TPR) repeat protein